MDPDRAFMTFLGEQLDAAGIGSVSLRRMFGSTGVFCDGLMIGLVDRDDVLYLRVDGESREAFVEAGFGDPFTYGKQGKVVSLGYLRIPDGVLDEPEALALWGRESLTAAQRIASGRGRRGT